MEEGQWREAILLILLCFDVGKGIPLRRLGCVVSVVFGEQKGEKAKK